MRALLVAVAVLTLAACGGGSSSPGDADAAWQTVLSELGLTPDQGLVDLSVAGSAPELDVTIAVPPDARELTFGDGLYGVVVYALRDGAWERVDTADVRTEIAPILGPGQSATVAIPVEEAPSYRVLLPLPAESAAVWTDYTP